MSLLANLTEEYQNYLDDNNLDQLSADELLFDLLWNAETPESEAKYQKHKDYLESFIERWDLAQESDQ